MDLRRLRYFLVLAEELHFQRAAMRIPLAQSSLSSQIAQLEREVGGALLVRSSRSCELTDLGKMVAADARRLLAEMELIAEGIRGKGCSIDRTHRFVVGCHDEGLDVLTPVVTSVFAAAYPEVQVVTKSLEYSDLPTAVERGLVDVVLAERSSQPPDVDGFVPLIATQPLLAVRAADFEGQKRVSARMAAEMTFVDDPRISDHFRVPYHLVDVRNGEAARVVESPLADTHDVFDAIASSGAVLCTTQGSARRNTAGGVSFLLLDDAPEFVVGVRTVSRATRLQRGFVDIATAVVGSYGLFDGLTRALV
ncbi:MAG: LysR family transcriptional regulator [Acidimicrobiales bacterium]